MSGRRRGEGGRERGKGRETNVGPFRMMFLLRAFGGYLVHEFLPNSVLLADLLKLPPPSITHCSGDI